MPKITESKTLPAWLFAFSGFGAAGTTVLLVFPELLLSQVPSFIAITIGSIGFSMALGLPWLALLILLVQQLRVEPKKSDIHEEKLQLLKVLCLTTILLALSLFTFSFLSYTAFSWAFYLTLEVNMFLETASASLLLVASWIWVSGKLANRAFSLGENWNRFFVMSLCMPPISWLAVLLVTMGNSQKTTTIP
jgi:hypothetical protein